MLDTLIPNAKVSAKLGGTMLGASVPQGGTPTPPPVPPTPPTPPTPGTFDFMTQTVQEILEGGWLGYNENYGLVNSTDGSGWLPKNAQQDSPAAIYKKIGTLKNKTLNVSLEVNVGHTDMGGFISIDFFENMNGIDPDLYVGKKYSRGISIPLKQDTYPDDFLGEYVADEWDSRDYPTGEVPMTWYGLPPYVGVWKVDLTIEWESRRYVLTYYNDAWLEFQFEGWVNDRMRDTFDSIFSSDNLTMVINLGRGDGQKSLDNRLRKVSYEITDGPRRYDSALFEYAFYPNYEDIYTEKNQWGITDFDGTYSLEPNKYQLDSGTRVADLTGNNVLTTKTNLSTEVVNLKNITIHTWIKIDGYGPLFGQYTSDNYGTKKFISVEAIQPGQEYSEIGCLQINIGADSFGKDFDFEPIMGKWIMLTMTVSEGVCAVYINNKFVFSWYMWEWQGGNIGLDEAPLILGGAIDSNNQLVTSNVEFGEFNFFNHWIDTTEVAMMYTNSWQDYGGVARGSLPAISKYNYVTQTNIGGWGYGPTFSQDGTMIFNGDISGANYNYATLSTPYDITSITERYQYPTIGQGDRMGDGLVVFSNDGMYCFLGYNYTIRRYHMTQDPYDMQHMELDQTVEDANINVSRWFGFDPTGTILYSNTGQAHLSTAWDLTSITSYDVFSLAEELTFGSEMGGVVFSANGDSVYLSCYGSGLIHRYYLETPRDLRTATDGTIADFSLGLLGVNYVEHGGNKILFTSDTQGEITTFYSYD